MTTKEYEPEDLIKALELSGAQTVGNISTDNARDALILLGLTVKPEKPEPGVYLDAHGNPVIIGMATIGNQTVHVYGDGRLWRHDAPLPPLTPARVVPAGRTLPAPLTDEQVGELWDRVTGPGVPEWMDYRTPRRLAIKRTVNAAIAKHGHGRAEVTREPLMQGDILEVIHAALGEHGEKACFDASRAVWDLLGGGDRG